MIRRGVRLVVLLAVAAGSATADHRQPAHPRHTHQATIQGVSAYSWENGLTALLVPDVSRGAITVAITYFVGSRHESYGQTGLAHLLEHLVFDSSRSHPDIGGELAGRGGRANAATGADSTMFYETVPATLEDLEWALTLEADRMAHAVITPERLARESAIVRSELAIDEDNAPTALTERLYSAAFTWHNYGKGVGGALSDLHRVTAAQAIEFYRTHYRPDNALLVVAGAIDIPTALRAIDTALGGIPRPDERVAATRTVEPPQEGARTIELRRAGDVRLFRIGYHIPGASHPDYAPLEILAGLMGRDPSGLLQRTLVRAGLAGNAFGYAGFRRDPGLLVFGAEASADTDPEPPLETMLATVENSSGPFTEDEIARERRRAMNEMDETLRSTEAFALEIGDWAAVADWRLFFVHRSRLESVTAHDVDRVRRRYVTASNRTLAHLVPDGTAAGVRVEPTAESQSFAGYSATNAITEGEPFDPSPESVEGRIIRSRLSTGLRVALLPKRTRGQQAHAVLNLRFGDAESLDGRRWTGHLTARMLLRGTTRRARNELQDAFAEAGVRVTVSGGADGVTATISAARPRLVPALRLVTEAFRSPSFPQAEFEELKRSTLLSVEAQKLDPEWSAWNAIYRALHPYPPGDLRRTQTADEKAAAIRRVTLADVRRFHGEFYGASAGEFVVVGDFDSEELQREAEACFRGWSSSRPFRAVARVYQEAGRVELRLDQPDRRNSILEGGLVLAVGEDSPEYPALLLGAYVMGGGSLNSRLPARIRRRDGLSYWVESGVYGSPGDRVLTFLTTIACEPANLGGVRAAFLEEIERSTDGGFTPAEVEAAKTGWLHAQEMSVADDEALASALAADLREGRTRMWHAALRQRIKELPTEEVSAVWRKHIRASAISLVESGDFASGN